MRTSQLISSDDPARWNKFVESLGRSDIYHTAEYHLAEQTWNEGESFLFSFQDGQRRVAIPFLLRRVSTIPGLEDEPYRDATSVYGYPGALTNFDVDSSDAAETRRLFEREWVETLKNLNVVSFFGRQHPLFPTQNLYAGIAAVKPLGKTVAVDLTQPEEEWSKQRSKGAKSDIKRARRIGVQIVEDTTLERIDEFIAVYNATMSRLGAAAFYYFPKAYYEALARYWGKSGKFRLYFSERDGEVLSTALFFFHNEIVQYHLSGSTPKARNDGGSHRLLLDTVLRRAKDEGYKYFHLGGGAGSAENDSLFRFKASFSKQYYPFYVVCLATRPKVVRRLNEKRIEFYAGTEDAKTLERSSYFPPYRTVITNSRSTNLPWDK